MQLKFKTILPWGLSIILTLILVLRECGRKTLDSTIIESTIETKTQVEESLVDSFSVERNKIQISRDSALQGIDTLGILDLQKKLQENIFWYETDSIFGYPRYSR